MRVSIVPRPSWSNNTAAGVTVYRPDGTRRLHVLPGKTLQSGRAIGNYLYVNADARYTVDLRTGKVFGPLASDAAPISLDLVAIP